MSDQQETAMLLADTGTIRGIGLIPEDQLVYVELFDGAKVTVSRDAFASLTVDALSALLETLATEAATNA